MVMHSQIIHGDAIETMRTLEDPPYSEYTHGKSRRGIANYKNRTGEEAHAARNRQLGFEPLSDELRFSCAHEFRRLTKRWVLVFTDDRGLSRWTQDLQDAGLEWIRTGVWRGKGATPQLTGDRTAVSCEKAGYVAIARHELGGTREQIRMSI